MKKLRTLAVSFDTQINPWELPRFRGAMAHKVGLEHEWFHNHDNETGGFHQRYPLIQYKIDPHKGERRPMLLCLDQGIEEAHHFFGQPDWSLDIGGQHHALRIAHLHVDQVNLHLWERDFTYKVHKWIALNSDHFATWQRTDRLADRLQLLEEILTSHLLSFARGVDWQLENHLQVRLTDLLREEWVEYKDVKVLAFTIAFKTNASLPDLIGLGKGSSVGFGVVRRQRD